MRQKSVLSLVVGLILSGCVFIQEFINPQPTTTQPLGITETLTPTSVPSPSPPLAPSPSGTKVVATAPVETVTSTIAVTQEPSEPQMVLGTSKYVRQAGSPTWLPNFSHPEMGCNFLGVAGQVFGDQGAPEVMLIVEAGGTLGASDIFALSLTGNDSIYGPGGFELILSDQLAPSNGSVWIQVFNLEGQALSERIYFDTFSDCQRNLVLINFVESSFAGAPRRSYLPHIFKNSAAPLATTPAP